MFMTRDVFQCKPGKAKDLVARFKIISEVFTKHGLKPMRIYTDIGGERYWTVVIEQDMAKLDEIVARADAPMSDPKVAEAFKGYHDFVVSGRREIFRLEE